jgi:hypothetical protein
MEMTPRIDIEAREYRQFEQPAGRFGSDHVIRDEVPAINPEILDFQERQEAAERALLAEERRAQLAVADTVSIDSHFYL